MSNVHESASRLEGQVSGASPVSGDPLRPLRADGASFVSQARLQPGGRTFGGRLIAECLSAAAQAVDPVFLPHAIHLQFLNPGDTGAPMRYEVEPLRDGRNFASRQVRARQAVRTVCVAMASLSRHAGGREHQPSMPAVPRPADLAPTREAREALVATSPRLARLLWHREHPVDIRLAVSPDSPAAREGRLAYWFRPLPGWEDLSDPIGRAAVVAYMSDRLLMTTNALARPELLENHDLVLSSLDHALWLHRDYAPGSWILYSLESVTIGGRRAFARGQMFAENGDHIASVGQEGLVDTRPGRHESGPQSHDQ